MEIASDGSESANTNNVANKILLLYESLNNYQSLEVKGGAINFLTIWKFQQLKFLESAENFLNCRKTKSKGIN